MKLFFSDYSNEPQHDILVMIGETAAKCTDLCSFKMFDFSTLLEEDIAWRLQIFDDAWKYLAEDCVVDMLTEITEGINPMDSLRKIGATEIPVHSNQSQS